MTYARLKKTIVGLVFLMAFAGCFFESESIDTETSNSIITYKIPLNDIDPHLLDKVEVLIITNGAQTLNLTIPRAAVLNYISPNATHTNIFMWSEEVEVGAEITFLCTFFVGENLITYSDIFENIGSSRSSAPLGFKEDELAAFMVTIQSVAQASSAIEVSSSDVLQVSSVISNPGVSSISATPATSSSSDTPTMSSSSMVSGESSIQVPVSSSSVPQVSSSSISSSLSVPSSSSISSSSSVPSSSSISSSSSVPSSSSISSSSSLPSSSNVLSSSSALSSSSSVSSSSSIAQVLLTFPVSIKFEGDATIEGQAHTGTTTGSVSYAAGKSGQAISFSGASNRVEYVGSEDVFRLQEFTFSCWFKVDIGSSGQYREIVNNGRSLSGVSEGYYLFIGSNNKLAFSIAPNNGSHWSATVTQKDIEEDIWYHVAASYDGDVQSLYVNGELVSQINITSTIDFKDSIPLTIGGRSLEHNVGEYNFQGLIDELTIYNTARTAAEILTESGFVIPMATIDFENSAVIDELSTTGTVSGAVSYEAGKVGQAVSFSGAGNYIEFLGPDSVFRIPEVSISAWFKVDAPSGVARDIVQNGRALPSVREGWYLYVANDNKLAFSFGCQGGGSWCEIKSPGIISEDTWYHAAATYDGTDAKMYINGELVKQKTFSSAIYYNIFVPLTVSGRNPTYGSVPAPFEGVIDEVKIYNQQLTIEQVQNAAGLAP